MTGTGRERAPEILTHPLWGLTCVLGEIALRIVRDRADEGTTGSPETRSAGGATTAREEDR